MDCLRRYPSESFRRLQVHARQRDRETGRALLRGHSVDGGAAWQLSLADKAYQKGIDAGAKPLSLLKRRFREFQRRMSRHWLNQDEAARRQEDHHERAIGNDRKPKERKFGGAITRDQAKPGSSRVSRDAPSARPFQIATDVADENNNNVKAAPAPPAFEVYDDTTDNGDTVDLVNHFFSGGATEEAAEPVKWNSLPSRKARTKENTVQATAWAGQTLPSSSFESRSPNASACALCNICGRL